MLVQDRKQPGEKSLSNPEKTRQVQAKAETSEKCFYSATQQFDGDKLALEFLEGTFSIAGPFLTHLRASYNRYGVLGVILSSDLHYNNFIDEE